MIRALEPRPLIVAALIGSVAFWALRRSGRQWSDLALGAGVGVAVQLGVRLVGVS